MSVVIRLSFFILLFTSQRIESLQVQKPAEKQFLSKNFHDAMQRGSEFLYGHGVQADFDLAHKHFLEALEYASHDLQKAQAKLGLALILSYGNPVHMRAHFCDTNLRDLQVALSYLHHIIDDDGLPLLLRDRAQLVMIDIFRGKCMEHNPQARRLSEQLLTDAHAPEIQALAHYRLGLIYYTLKDYALAYKHLKDSNVVQSYFWLSSLYRKGEGVEKNILLSRKYALQALKYDTTLSELKRGALDFNIARSYATINPTTKSLLQKALSYYLKVINNPFAEQLTRDYSSFQVGEMYYKGTPIVTRDFKKAVFYLKPLVSRTSLLDPKDQYRMRLMLGDIYAQHGMRSSDAYKFAADYYKQVTEQTKFPKLRAEAQLSLGILYRLGGYGLQQNEKAGVALIQEAAAQELHEEVRKQAFDIIQRAAREKIKKLLRKH